MRTFLVAILLLIATPALVFLLFVAKALGVEDKPGGVYDRVPNWWARLLLWGSGVRLRVHHRERLVPGEPHVFVCNHLSWHDVFAMAAAVPRARFVTKAELFRIPVLSFGMRAVGMIRIERENRKAAFGSYDQAAARIRGGTHVVVYPEGTRGFSYELRPFKKGPFVLAIAAGVPIIPVVMHGQLEVMRKGDWRIRPGVIDLYFLEPVPTDGYGYEQRGELLDIVRRRMAEALREYHAVPEPGDLELRRPAASRTPSTTDLNADNS
jgi:1-acyl-sn-glycerol-3-phosphate acyltransferase